MVGGNLVSCGLFESLELQILLVVFVAQLIHWATELSLEGLKIFFELSGYDKLGVFHIKQVSVILVDSQSPVGSKNVWKTIFIVVDFSQHDCSQIFTELWVKHLWLSAENVSINWSHFYNATIGLVRHGKSEIAIQYFGKVNSGDFMDSFEPFGPKWLK